jgi:hypothetical protein
MCGIVTILSMGLVCALQEPAAAPTQAGQPGPLFVVAAGTKVPLVLLNGLSTKHSAEGDRVYLTTSFPIVSGGRVVIPPGSFVAGTITHVKRPGRVKGRGELFLRFDELTLPNGVVRNFRSRIGSMDGDTTQTLDRKEGTIQSPGNKAGDLETVAEVTAAAAGVGGLAGSTAGRSGLGAGLGAAGGLIGGVMAVLLTRGPDVTLSKGTSFEMLLDRELRFQASELTFEGNTSIQVISSGTQDQSNRQKRQSRFPGSRIP